MNMMDRGREELRLGGETRRKEEAESQKEKQLERNGKHGKRQQKRRSSCADPRAHSRSPKRQTHTPQLRHRCAKVQTLKSTSISVPFPHITRNSHYLPFWFKIREKWHHENVYEFWQCFLTPIKTCKSPHVEDRKCSLVLLFNLMVGRSKQTEPRLSLLGQLGHLFRSPHTGSRSWEARKRQHKNRNKGVESSTAPRPEVSLLIWPHHWLCNILIHT